MRLSPRVRLAPALVAATCLAVVPPDAEAQVLRTLCTSPTMDYCLNVTAIDFWYSVPLPPFDNETNTMWTVFGSWTGAGIERLFAGNPVFTNMCLSWILPFTRGFGGAFMCGEGTGAGTPWRAQTLEKTTDQGVPLRDPTPHDIISMQVTGVPGGGVSCGEGFGSDCFDPATVVPEPATWLLLLTGLLGLGFAARRRRGVAGGQG